MTSPTLTTLRAALIAAAALGPAAAGAEDVLLQSPQGELRIILSLDGGRLTYRAQLQGKPLIEPSPLGILVDGVDLGQGVTLGKAERYEIDESFPWYGGHSTAVARGRGARVAVTHKASRTAFTVDLRAFDDAVAFRLLVPGGGRRVPDAASAFRLPAGSVVWVQGPRDHYEGLYTRRELKEVPAEEWATPPLTFRLPDGRGYGSVTEAGLRGYAGMMLQADGRGGFQERLGHAPPPSYPFTLRYPEEMVKRLSQPAAVEGEITTPWRVVLAGTSLDALVNSDAIAALSAPPDPKLFPQGLRTSWVRPGRAVWRYLDGGENTFEGIKEFSRLAGELGFEHHVVEGQWRRWTDEQVRELVEYSKARGVSIWVWIHSRDQRDAEARRKLFARLHGLGVAGLKVDFFDHEAKEVIDLYHDILRDAAEAELLVNFHGANKPAGESRTWPNELTREGIRGLEYRSTPAWAEHNVTVPFTRFLAGHADYTPLVFTPERRKETTWAHQIATVVVFTSPAMIYGGHPKSLLDSPAAELIKSLPSVWDETRVLPPSAVGEAAVFARRSGERWFVGMLNGTSARSVRLDLRFLGSGRHKAMLVRDKGEDGAALEVETREVSATDVLEVALRPAGGFVARFTK
jgi:alpha-glucosidase